MQKEKLLMREDLKSQPLYIIFDETRNTNFESVVALLVGSVTSPSKPYLLSLEIKSKVNGDVVAQFTSESLYRELGIVSTQLVFFVSDGAKYCLKAGKILKSIFPKMIHTTCISHALHLAFEDVRKKYPKANNCIASLKAVLSKCPERRSSFPTSIPPWPVVI